MIKNPNKTLFSFEVFPPKKTMSIDTVYNTLDELKDLKPDFISVTYGAGGSENCDNTLNIAKRIKNVCGVESVVHMPCNELCHLLIGARIDNGTFKQCIILSEVILSADRS